MSAIEQANREQPHHWLAAYGPMIGVISAAWLFTILMAIYIAECVGFRALGPGMGYIGQLIGDLGALPFNPCLQLCYGGIENGGLWWAYLHVFAMWCAMAAAMMLPTSLPLIETYRQITIGNPSKVPMSQLWFMIVGFLAVWTLFSSFAAALQVGLSSYAIVTPAMVATAPWLTIVLLVVAGLYQFSSVKQACVNVCRSPMNFLMSYWRDGAGGAFVMGLRQGLFCLGCCWALMMLAFIAGTMNLVWMFVAMVFMVLEKLPRFGEPLTKPAGVGLLVLACAVILRTAGG